MAHWRGQRVDGRWAGDQLVGGVADRLGDVLRQVAWQFHSDSLGPRPEYTYEGTPLCIKGRLYVTAGPDKKAAVTYRTPTSIFALYDNPKLDELAAEMDQVFAKIIDDAISG